MRKTIEEEVLIEKLCNERNILIIQDLDGVCIPLVKDPLTRTIDLSYVQAAAKMKDEFYVLTNGEHAGRRGVNKLIEKATGDISLPLQMGFYLPGLAAGGVEYQNQYGEIKHPGVKEEEIQFLSKLPLLMKKHLRLEMKDCLQSIGQDSFEKEIELAVIDTNLSPTINLNGIFLHTEGNVDLQVRIQKTLKKIMDNILHLSNQKGLQDSFFLHIAPNLGRENGEERMKYASKGDIGTTDIQFMIKGAIKEAGLLYLLNEHIGKVFDKKPFGDDFTVRECPTSIQKLLKMCIDNISAEEMPLLIGVGDTVTSTYCKKSKKWLRGGSDRGFLTLIQELGKSFNKENQIILVDSSGGEVERPSLSDVDLKGISDPSDPLKFTHLVKQGPAGYINLFKTLSRKRNLKK